MRVSCEPDLDQARHYLLQLNYYRLRGYWLPFERPVVRTGHELVAGTQFEDVLSVYLFDRYLRLWLMDLVERVEVSIRAQWSHTMGMRHGPHFYLNGELFRDPELHASCLEGLGEAVRRSHEVFIKHYLQKYTYPRLPPAWAVFEVMSLGQPSKWVGNLKQRAGREAVLKVFGGDELVLCSFLHHLTHIRNLCAHHCRLWNRSLTVTIRIPKYPRWLAESFNRTADRKIYNTIVMLGHMVAIISPEPEWRRKLLDLMAAYRQVNPAAMGFPSGWQQVPIWNR